jgi:biopolymer transport protein ExbB
MIPVFSTAGTPVYFDVVFRLLERIDEPATWYDLAAVLGGYVRTGGWVMPPLLISLVLLWYGIGYRWITLRRLGKRHVGDLLASYRAGKWARPRDILGRAIVRGWELKKHCRADLRAALEDAFGEYDGDLRCCRTLIRVIVTTAPLLGLLGTVSGMIETFDSLKDNVLFSQSGGVAGGISQALLTTQLGLAVAIPGLILQGLLARRQQQIEIELDQLKELLIGSPSQTEQEVSPA